MAAAACTGMALATLAGAAASASASTTHHVVRVHHDHSRGKARVKPNIPIPTDGVTATSGAPTQVSTTTLDAGTSVALPTVTIGDPGIIKSGDTVTLTLRAQAGGVSFDTSAVATVTATGATAGPATVTATSVAFVVTKVTDGTHATYTVAGLQLVGTSTTTSGAFGVDLSAGTPGSPAGPGNVPPAVPPTVDATVPAFALGAVTRLLPAAAGATSPETAAILFRAQATGSPTAAVLASDAEPQDAESANYLADEVNGPSSAILLTNPTTLSPAVTSTLSLYNSISTIYIVGGTSVVSAAIATQLEQHYTVVRLAGQTAYDTNSFVINYVAQNLSPYNDNINLDYAHQSPYNSTSGASSAATTGIGGVKTAIVASGDIHAFQDGLVSGPLSYDYGLPVVLTTSRTLSSTALGLLTQGGYKQVILVGGPGAVSDAVEAQLAAPLDSGGAGVAVFRVAGSDASDTATKMAAFMEYPGYQIDDYNSRDEGTPDGGVLIARGTGFQDPLAAGPYAGDNGYTPILLTENATVLGAPLAAYLHTMGSRCIFAVQAIGGPASVTPGVQQAAIDAEFAGLNNSCLQQP